MMHTVGRTYAREAGVTLRDADGLPAAEQRPGVQRRLRARPGDRGGAGHRSAAAGRGGARLRATRARAIRRYSCIHGFGHAFMRIYGDRLGPALDLCRALGRGAAADCAQGAYHDYWFAVAGADDTTLPDEPVTDPRRLCGAAARARSCGRAGIARSSRTARGRSRSTAPEDLDVLCSGSTGSSARRA